jgi:hypothetical protein
MIKVAGEFYVRVTLLIDDDVLTASRELAAAQRKGVGEVISALARRGLQPNQIVGGHRNGVPLLAVGPGARPVTSEIVRQLDTELP